VGFDEEVDGVLCRNVTRKAGVGFLYRLMGVPVDLGLLLGRGLAGSLSGLSLSLLGRLGLGRGGFMDGLASVPIAAVRVTDDMA
jgi:hypothetical protein